MNTAITYRQKHDVYNLRPIFMHKAQWKLALVLVITLLYGYFEWVMYSHYTENAFLSQLTNAILMAAVSDILYLRGKTLLRRGSFCSSVVL